MKPRPFVYHDPDTVAEVVRLLATLDNAKLLAGGQSLMPMLNFRVVAPDHVVDLNRIEELQGIREDGERIVIAAMTRQSDIERSELLQRRCPLFREALLHVGHRQTRNRGTIGGSLSHMDGAAELPIVALALNAELRIESARGSRTLAMRDFPVSYLTTALQEDEVLTAVSVTAWGAGHGWAFEEFARRRGDFAVVAAAALLVIEGGNVTRASLVLGGVGPGPVRLVEAEKSLVGATAGEQSWAEAAGLAAKVEAHADIHASTAYRQRLASVLVYRTLQRAGARAMERMQ